MRGTMLLHERLWRHSEDLVQACRQHRFVRGIEDGTLDREVFERYVSQDTFYLEAFFRAYAFAAGRCEGRHATAVLFYRLMGGVLEELELHARRAERLGIELSTVRPLASTTAYTGFLLETARQRDLATIVAAMTPCMRLYAYLGQELVASADAGNPYRDWIETYSSAAIDQLASDLETLLDELAEDCPEVRDAYRHAMECELVFFEGQFTP